MEHWNNRGEREKLFIEFQLINVEEMMKLQKKFWLPLVDCFRQELIHAKPCMQEIL